jgi:hypothetical protein
VRQGDQGPHRGGGEPLEKREARFASGDLQRPSSPPRQRGNVGVFERKRQAEPTCKTLDEGGVQIRVGSPDVMVKMGHAGEVDMTALGELVQDRIQRARAKPISMALEFFNHRHAADRLFVGVVQDVKSNEPSEEVPQKLLVCHRRDLPIDNRY